MMTSTPPTMHVRPTHVTLRALTWNVGRLLPQKKIGKAATARFLRGQPVGMAATAHDKYLPHIAKVIYRTQPDIVTLQEIASPAQAEYIRQYLGPEYTCFVPHLQERYDRYVAVFTKIKGVDYIPIQTSSGRVAVSADLGDLLFVGLHADASDHRTRFCQLEEILAWLESRRDRRIILAGDFNLNLHAMLKATRSANREIYRTITDVYGFHDTTRIHGATTYPSRRLDYVFVNFPPSDIGSCHILRRARIGTMDHRPILVDFIFPR